MLKTRRRSGIPVTLALIVALSGPVARAAAEPAIGKVGDLIGQCQVTRDGESEAEPLGLGIEVFEGDRVRTAADARLRLELVDGSVVQLGESTDLALDWFRNSPELETRSVFLRLPAGILRVLVALVPASAFEVQTATAVASVRGTEWIAEAGAAATAIVALAGEVAVSSDQRAIAGEVVLGPGEGTTVEAGQPPQVPKAWGEARKSAFIERTAVR